MPPSVRAASSKRRSSWRSAASTVITRNGIATNVWATTTAAVRERQPDVEPPVEVLAERGRAGRTRRTARRRRRPAAAPSTACTARARRRGPGTRRGPAATPAARRTGSRARSPTASRPIDSRSAVRTRVLGEVRSHASPHGARHSRPRNGSAKNAIGDEREHQRRAGKALTSPARRVGHAAASAAPAHGARKPYSARIVWPCVAERRSRRTPARPPALAASLVTTIGYSAMHVDVGRDLDAFGVVAGGGDVGDVDDAGVGLAQRSPW